jgi:hypothetical protein
MKLKSTLESIFAEFSTELYTLRETGDLDDALYEATFEYLMDNNLIPYGTATAKTGDPYNFVADYLMDGYNR